MDESITYDLGMEIARLHSVFLAYHDIPHFATVHHITPPLYAAVAPPQILTLLALPGRCEKSKQTICRNGSLDISQLSFWGSDEWL